MVKISVIVPIYGAEKYLKECLESILCQTLKDIEIILVDDGSKDKCPQMIDEYAKKDSRIIPVHKENGGWGSALNAGLKRSKGEYIAIVEPDDYIKENMYQDLYEIAKNNNSDVVKSSFIDNLQFNNKFVQKKVKWDVEKIPKYSFCLKECPLFLSYHPSIWSAIYKREFLNKNNIVFLDEKGASWQDNIFQVQTLSLAEKINYTDNAYYYWRRLKECPSDSLRDFTIPFKRMNEIYLWLNENNIKDKNILSSLAEREISYINIALGSVKLNRLKEIKHYVDFTLEYISKEGLNEKFQDELKSLKNNLFCKIMCIKLKNLRKKLLSIRLQEKRITFLGKTIVF